MRNIMRMGGIKCDVGAKRKILLFVVLNCLKPDATMTTIIYLLQATALFATAFETYKCEAIKVE